MRKARIKAENAGYYHCMSRIIERRHILGAREKEKLHHIMRSLEGFCGLEILTYCIMSNHLHILLRIPERREVSDRKLLRRFSFAYEPHVVKQLAAQLKELRNQSRHDAAELLKTQYTYGEAMGGCRAAQAGIRRILHTLSLEASWARVGCIYRKCLFVQGRQKGLDPKGRPIIKGFSREKVQEVLEKGGKLPVSVLLRCRVRYFSDGLVLGSRAFVEHIFHQYRDQFSPKRSTGAQPMRYGQWGGLCTLRNLRLSPVSMY